MRASNEIGILIFYMTFLYSQDRNFGRVHLKRIFDDRKLKNHIFASFSPYRCNLSIVKSSFCRYASSIVACESTSRSSKFIVGIEAGHDCGPYASISLPQVQRIKHNLVVHGSIRKPKVIQQGRKSKITPEMEEVRAPLYSI